uniref:ATP synthase F0 subunit 8 n=1 Tax=Dicranoptycha shandongensis TaxID=3102771 RepID=UPI002E79F40A|nr:ATP synthase F0 subunit 8 [Dicranoptycha shandongensis]WPO00997.1 ATP synthase F0 subunit 8 [Dicranoptycha shandongensis]
MPQMAPLSWLLLFIIFSITLIIFNTLNYFHYSLSPQSTKLTFTIKKPSLNWKW